jgi:hypothetical protein
MTAVYPIPKNNAAASNAKITSALKTALAAILTSIALLCASAPIAKCKIKIRWPLVANPKALSVNLVAAMKIVAAKKAMIADTSVRANNVKKTMTVRPCPMELTPATMAAVRPKRPVAPTPIAQMVKNAKIHIVPKIATISVSNCNRERDVLQAVTPREMVPNVLRA